MNDDCKRERESSEDRSSSICCPLDGYLPESDEEARFPLGNKGYWLRLMESWNLPVPPGFVITIDGWRALRENEENFLEIIRKELGRLEEKTGRRFSDRENPLFISIRSSPPVSMAGVMLTLLNVGINDKTINALKNEIGARGAYQSYLDLIINLGCFLGIDSEKFSDLVNRSSKTDEAGLESLIFEAKKIYKRESGEEFPQNINQQILKGIQIVFGSWESERTRRWREELGIPENWGTACIIQQMIFTNRDAEKAGAGVLLTHDPSDLIGGPLIIYAPGKQGMAVVGDGTRESQSLAELPDSPMKSQLEEIFGTISQHCPLPQELEFSYDGDTVWCLQLRELPLSPLAKLRFLIEQIKKGLLPEKEAISQMTSSELQQLLQPSLNEIEAQKAEKEGRVLCREGWGISPGVAYGYRVITSLKDVWSDRNEFIYWGPLSLDDTSKLLQCSSLLKAIITSTGSLGSHLTRALQRFNIPVIIGAPEAPAEIAEKICTVEAIGREKVRVFRGLIPLEEKNAMLTQDERQIVKRWSEERKRNPWYWILDRKGIEKVAQFVAAEKAREIGLFKSSKAKEITIVNALIPAEIREDYSIMSPNKVEEIITRLEKNINDGYDASIRTCIHPDLPGRGRWIAISSLEEIKNLFKKDKNGVSPYDRLIEPIEGSQVTEVLIGALPKNKLNLEFNDEHCVWSLIATSDGQLILQMLPHTIKLREFATTKKEKLVTSVFDKNLKVLRLEFGSSLVNDQKAKKIFTQVRNTVLGWIKEYDLVARIAAIAQLFPNYYSPILEGQARISGKQSKGWCLVYGINFGEQN